MVGQDIQGRLDHGRLFTQKSSKPDLKLQKEKKKLKDIRVEIALNNYLVDNRIPLSGTPERATKVRILVSALIFWYNTLMTEAFNPEDHILKTNESRRQFLRSASSAKGIAQRMSERFGPNTTEAPLNGRRIDVGKTYGGSGNDRLPGKWNAPGLNILFLRILLQMLPRIHAIIQGF